MQKPPIFDTDYFISTDKLLLDFDVIHKYLCNDSYWSPGIPMEKVRKAADHSLCFGIYCKKEQVGYARVITDYASFAYVADVFVLPEHRGKGLSKQLMSEIMSHSELQGLRRWLLATLDAHDLYKQFGWTPLAKPDRFMEVHQPNIYKLETQ